MHGLPGSMGGGFGASTPSTLVSAISTVAQALAPEQLDRKVCNRYFPGLTRQNSNVPSSFRRAGETVRSPSSNCIETVLSMED